MRWRHWRPFAQVVSEPLGQSAPTPPHVEPLQKVTALLLQVLRSLQAPPNGVLDAAWAGAVTDAMTGTVQAMPPTMPAFFRKSRREADGFGAAAELEIWV